MKLILSLLLLIVIALYAGLKVKDNVQDQVQQTGGKETYLNNDQIEIVQTLKDIHEVFEKHDIWYVISCGTLLGAVRHWGIIPWDDDADIYVLKKDRDKIWKAKQDLEKRGRRLEKTWKLDRILCHKDTDRDMPFIDLFYIQFDDNGDSVRCLLNKCNEAAECCAFPKTHKWWWVDTPKWSEVNPRKLYELNGVKLYGHGNPMPYLQKMYGKDCLTTCMTHSWDHVKGEKITPTKIKCKNMRAPQLP